MNIHHLLCSKFSLLILFILIGGVGNVILCHENVWDWVNYHYYNVWALFHHRLGYDLAPASVNTYFNPIIDIPYYLMVKYWNNFPSLINFCQGISFGFLLFAIYSLLNLFFISRKEIALGLFIAATGFSTFSQWGTSSNEISISALILWSIYLILKDIKYGSHRTGTWVLAGLLMGIAPGLKLTAAISCVTVGIVLIVLSKKLGVSWKEIVVFGCFGLCGFLMVNGWLMVKLYSLFTNPFFPFFNKIFQSEYFENFNFSDDSFVKGRNWFHKVFLPFIFLLDSRYVSEKAFVDIRLAIVWCGFAVYLIRFICRKVKPHLSKEDIFLFAFILIFYFVWANFFSIIRYAVVIEVMSAIFIVILFRNWNIKNKFGNYLVQTFKIFCVILLVIITPLCSESWGNLSNEKSRVDLEKIRLPDEALVKVYGIPLGMPAAMIVGDATNRIVAYSPRGYINGFDLMEKGKFFFERQQIEQASKGEDIYLLDLAWYGVKEVLEQLQAHQMYCRPLRFNLRFSYICVPQNLKQYILLEEDNSVEFTEKVDSK